MAKAIFNGQVIAESDHFEVVEGNVYFPPDTIRREFFSDNTKTTSCFWKGTAHYYDVTVDGRTGSAAAWYYPTPKSKAANIKDHVAFWGDVTVER